MTKARSKVFNSATMYKAQIAASLCNRAVSGVCLLTVH